VTSFPAPFAAREGARGRPRAFTGTVWEERAGFARAIRVGDRVLVSGTTATHGTRLIGAGDAEAQAHAAFDKVEGRCARWAASLEDVVRTRVYVADVADAGGVTRAHGRGSGTCSRRTRSCRPRWWGTSISWRSKPMPS
jgi:enamine deaminase RidA (YjgF/YER057c/UK114 family)